METTSVDIRELNERIQRESAFIDLINLEMDKVIVGQKYMVERLMIGLLSNGHSLLEGVPGLAKTLAIKSLSSTWLHHNCRQLLHNLCLPMQNDCILFQSKL